jgi:hypothetical protein
MTKRFAISSHLSGWLYCSIVIFLLPCYLPAAPTPSLTLVSGTMYRADGAPATGQIIISWPPFTTADQKPVSAGTKTLPLGSSGEVGISLFPTAGATPAGTLYKIVVKLTDGTTSTEYWSVPNTPTATLSSVRVNTAQSATTGNISMQSMLTGKLGRQGDTPVSMDGIRFASEFAGTDPATKTANATTDCKGEQCTIVLPSGMTPGGLGNIADNAKIIDFRGNTSPYNKALAIRSRWTNIGPGLQLVGNLLLDTEAYRGGVNFWNGAGTKTQFASLWLSSRYRTIGERKDITQEMWCLGKGDCIGYMNTTYDFGGAGTGGDEGHAGIRVVASQGLGNVFPQGTVTAAKNSKLSASWSYGYALGEQRPIINTSRGVYSTGTLSSSTVDATPCVITGSGTNWDTLGTGTHRDLFLEIVPLSNASTGAKFVLPITRISDATHLVAEYKLVSVNETCLGRAITPGMSYKIFRGAIATSLDDPAPNTTDPAAVNLAVPASMFQVGDTVQQPLGYNSLTVGMNLFVGNQIGPAGQGYGAMLDNSGAVTLESGLRIFGNFKQGIRFANNTGGKLISSSGTSDMLIETTDKTTPTTQLVVARNMSGTTRNLLTYDRAGDKLNLGTANAIIVDANTGAIGFGSNPILPWSRWNFQWTDPTQGGLNVNAPAGVTRALFSVQNNGISRFFVNDTAAVFSNGIAVSGYYGNLATQTWGIDSSSGKVWAAKFCYNSARTVCDYAGTGAPTGACTTGSTYRRTDGGANSTFYVCEKSQWAAK